MSVYGVISGLLLISGHYQLLAFPALIGGLHYLKMVNGVTSITTSYDMQKLQKRNKQFRQVFEELKLAIEDNEECRPYFISKDTVLIHNPFFDYFQYREKQQVDKLDQQRDRLLFECSVQDATTGAEGKIQSIVVMRKIEKTTYFESCNLHLTKPENKKIKLVKFNVDAEEEEIYPKDTPRGTQRSRSSQDGDLHQKM